jgi:MFS family permease
MSVLSLITVPLFGFLSDGFGRKRTYLIGCAIMIVFPFLYYGLLDTKMALLVFLAIAISLPLHDMQYGPQAALIAESFTGRLRYSGASLGYQLASVIAGGPAPIVAGLLLNAFHTSFAIAIYLALCAVVSVLATLGLRDNRGRDITREYDEATAAVGPSASPVTGA